MSFFERLFRAKEKIPDGYKKYNAEEIKKFIEEDIKNRKIILFFDEINTCNSLGLVKNIICDKNFRNKNNIPDRFIIICACNPYRILSEENQNLEFGMSIEKYKRRKLVYTVNPLPYSTLNFILDFNNLENETTKIYIKNMSNKRFPNISNNIRELIT